MKTKLASVLCVLCALAALLWVKRADALSYRKITDEEMKTMANRIIAIGKASDDKEEMKDLLDIARRVRPIVELVDAKCPMPLKVANGTNVPVFNVEISVSERRGTSGTRIPQTFHIPYIPPKSMVTGTLACAISTYSYGYQAYGDRDIYMSATPIADHSRLDEEGIKKMLGTNVDLSTDSYDFSSTSAGALARPTALDAILGRDGGAAKTAFNPNKPSILSAILGQLTQADEDDDFKFFVQGLLRSNDGAAALGTWLRGAPGAHAKVTPLLATAQPAKVRALLEEIMRGSGYGSGASTLVTSAVTRVCGPGQPEAERTSMWLAALGKDVTSEAMRATVLEKCGVGKEQTRARLKAAKPEQLGRALDGMSGELFDIAVSAMTESKSFGAASTLLAGTQNNEKFLAVSNAALGFVTPSQKELLLRNVASGATGALDGAKAKWLSAQLDELHTTAADGPLLRQILGDMAKGLVSNAAVRKVAYARWKDAGKDAFDPFMTALASRSHVLAPEWIRSQAEAGKLDLVELLSTVGGASAAPTDDTVATAEDDDDDSHAAKPTPKAAGRLGATKTSANTCHADAKSADACLAAVKGLELSKEAIDPAFAEAVSAFLRTSPRDHVAAKVATELAAIGVDMSDAVDALCKAAPSDPGRWGYGSGAEDPLTTAAALNAGHPCIATVKSARASAERWIAAGIGFRVTLALVPFGFVGLFARKRFVPVRAQLAKESAELAAVRSEAAVALRLSAPKTEEALAAGLTDAATFLSTDKNEEVAGAGRALGALSPERRSAILGQTRSLAKRAAETGNAATMLAELDGLVLYVACFAGREDQPQTVRRHAGFTGGWPEHIKGIVGACVADGRPDKVLSLVFMLGASGEKTTMLVGYDTPSIHFVPESLAAHDNELTHGHRYELSLGNG